MGKREAKQRREELRQTFNEVYQLAFIGSTDIRKEMLEKYRARFEELMEKKKGVNGNAQ